ncbi:hypothetical protein [Sphingomonas sp. GV3]|nr:hypothetical protein [Sphingomonas sp. GV3]
MPTQTPEKRDMAIPASPSERISDTLLGCRTGIITDWKMPSV